MTFAPCKLFCAADSRVNVAGCLIAARIRRRYGSIEIADGGSESQESSAELRYYQYTLLSRQDQAATSRGKKRKHAKQADDESESAYLFHVVPAATAT
jgi:hypothetical protein